MGVYIKEYRKPQTCGCCEFFKPWIHDRGDDSFCPLAVRETKASDRPSWCPIIELPPHGRLIDADALLQHQWVSSDWNCGGVHEIVVSITDIDDAPTIIEAEETNK